VRLRILVAHNRYRSAGGEDAAFDAEVALLRRQGHAVTSLEEDSSRIPVLGGLPVLGTTVSSSSAKARVREAIETWQPQVAHFHNIHPLFTPSVYEACRELGVPVIQSLHNYRLICPAATLFRSGHVCELCVGKQTPWPSVRYGCYRRSRLQSVGMTWMLRQHNRRGTWQELVEGYISMTRFMKGKLAEGGLPAERIYVKPNFVAPDPGAKQGVGDFALFVGRLSAEKGVDTLLDAWKRLAGAVPLHVVGDGPLAEKTQAAIESSAMGRFHGWQPHPEVLNLMKQSRFLVFPSVWYEGFPLVIAEAFAVGLPVLAANLGSAAEIIRDGETGVLFDPGSDEDLAGKASRLWGNLEACRAGGEAARREYERQYTPERNYERLIEIYDAALTSTGRDG
jgi:glycosyltransferase involved in cell wall biosynthesis